MLVIGDDRAFQATMRQPYKRPDAGQILRADLTHGGYAKGETLVINSAIAPIPGVDARQIRL